MRARNIKPGFFQNADLIDLPPLTRLLFAGLWCMADREGRLEDRPNQIKISILPGDACDVNSMLAELASKSFITRYNHAAREGSFIEIKNFKKHQNPHVKEPASTMPAPDSPGASTVLAGLIPDSGFLIPDSRDKRDKGVCTPKSGDAPPPLSASPLPERRTPPPFQKPSVEEIRAYCRERNNAVDAAAWMNHYQSNGWRVGRNPMKDWKAAVRTWEKNNLTPQNGRTYGHQQNQPERSLGTRLLDRELRQDAQKPSVDTVPDMFRAVDKT